MSEGVAVSPTPGSVAEVEMAVAPLDESPNGSPESPPPAAQQQQQQQEEEPLAADSLVAAKEAPKKAETALPPAYLDYLSSLRAAWHDLPDLTVTWENLALRTSVPRNQGHNTIPNLWTYFLDVAKKLNVFRDRSQETQTFYPIHASSGVVRPGTMTLVLAPPGHGKSALLKSLAGRMEREGKALQGKVRWNGLTAAESRAAGQQLSKLTAFVEQGDIHMPTLTVRETLRFATDNSTADAALLGDPTFAEKQARKVELMLELLGLRECADTIVGNAVLRGVSGGQRRRVTLGEMMIGQARALFLDEISNGLDASATFDIVSALKQWTRVMRGSVTAALLQPAPEVFDMFDEYILMREGYIVFAGTRAQLDAHLHACGLEPSPGRDFADWLVEFLTDPQAAWTRDTEAKGKASSLASFRRSFRKDSGEHAHVPPVDALAANGHQAAPSASSNGVTSTAAPGETESHEGPRTVIFHLDESEHPAPQAQNGVAAPQNGVAEHSAEGSAPAENRRKALGQVVSSRGIPLSTAALRQRYHDSALYSDLINEIRTRNDILRHKQQERATGAAAELSPFTRMQFYARQSRGLWFHTCSNIKRQALVMGRSVRTFVAPRILQAIFMGLVIGSLYWQLGTGNDDFPQRFGLILYSMIFMAFANMMEVPLASQFKRVVYKQVDAGFYSTLSYVASVILMQLPVSVGEVAIFGSLLYWMANFNPSAESWIIFLFIMFCVNLSIGVMFRSIAYAISNPDVAQNMAGPMTAIFLLFGGFLITADKIPNYCIWLYYLSPFSWAVRSGALNEFHSDRYTREQGDEYLNVWQIQTDDAWLWSGVGYLAGLFVFFVFVSAAALKYKRSWLTVGTRRNWNEPMLDDPEAAAAALAAEPADLTVRIGAKTTSMVAHAAEARAAETANQLPFTRMDLAFSDLRYTVTVTEKDDDGKPRTYDRALLAGVNGYARSGEMTALMGASGAGKTTLMDVLAGRKTAGKISGSIRVGGLPQQFPAFNRLMGYCEQDDVHAGMHTVREAITFSARLRLPHTVTDEQRSRFVEQILDDLELMPLANRLVGDSTRPGLAPGELKRLTVGVELAANPTFLFLDEPTSGLDSRAALVVMRVVRKVAQRGRTVVCTIHQPSAEIFGQFDRLLLLKSGGKEVYFGPVGDEGVAVADYFLNVEMDKKYFRPQLPENANVASWMLDVIGAGTAAKGLIAPYDEVYMQSALRARNIEVVQDLSQESSSHKAEEQLSVAVHSGVYAASYALQFQLVLRRLFTTYWRDTSYNSVKFLLMVFLGTLFGLVYLQINTDDEAGMISLISVLFMAFGFLGVLQASNAEPLVFRMRAVFYRERASNTFAPWVYSTTLGLVEMPYLLVCTILFVTPFYFLVGLRSSAAAFFQFLFVMYLSAVFFCFLAQFFSSLMPNIQVAHMIQGLAFTFCFLFGGVFIQKGAMPRGWIWMYYIDPIPKGLIAMALSQFNCEGGPDVCPAIYSVRYDGVVTKADFVQRYLATADDWYAYYVLWLLFSIVVMRVLVALVVQHVSHLKR